MNRFCRTTGTATTLPLQEQQAAYIFWMSNPYRGALHAEYPLALSTIEQVAFASANWDGEGALPVSAETKNNAREAIKVILPVAPAPEINSNPSGTLSFEWGTQQGSAHLEIGQTKYSFYVKPRVGAPILLEGNVDNVHQLHGSLVASLLYPSPTSASTMTPMRRAVDVRNTDQR